MLGSVTVFSADAENDRAKHETRLMETFKNAVMEGTWTLIKEGKMTPAREESYEIRSAVKVNEDDWVINSRIQYGTIDVTVPVPVKIFWAGDTPVISITELFIPGVGTYTARVMIFENTYSGYWSGKTARGMLHGVVRKIAPKEE